MTDRQPGPRAHQTVIAPCRCGCGLVRLYLRDQAGQALACDVFSHVDALKFAEMLVDAARMARRAEIGGDERAAH